MTNSKPKLLWTDDDHQKGRFRFEEKYIERKLGWECVWAHSVDEATVLLSTNQFDALILDQQLPLTAEANITGTINKENPWQGSIILYWLRNTSPETEDYDGYIKASLQEIKEKYMPIADNKNIPVTVMTSYYSEKVMKMTKQASLKTEDIEIFSKPVDMKNIELFLTRIRENKNLK